MRICKQCGCQLPRAGASCDVCEARVADVGSLDAPGGDLYAVAVMSRFLCRNCTRPSPVDELVASGTVRCVLCGFEQGLNPADWREVIDLAHDVGDLHGPEPTGRHGSPVAIDNPYADLGQSRVGVRIQQQGTSTLDGFSVPRSLSARLVPGHPLCDECGEPVSIELGDHTGTRCRSCGDEAQYRVSADHLAASQGEGVPPRGLVGVIADDARLARTHADGVLADGQRLQCAACGAALASDGSQRMVRCTFCEAMNHVAREVRHELQTDPAPDTWWMIFRGDSHRRLVLERAPAVADTLAADDHDDIDTVPVIHKEWPKMARWALVLGLPGLALAIATALIVAAEWGLASMR